MALEYVKRVFSKVGRGIPQVQQVDDDNQPLTDPKTGAPITGNEQYWADQLVSVPYTKGEGEEAEEDAETFILNALEATKGDLKLVASCFLDGFNKHLRLTAGGLDEEADRRGVCHVTWASGGQFGYVQSIGDDQFSTCVRFLGISLDNQFRIQLERWQHHPAIAIRPVVALMVSLTDVVGCCDDDLTVTYGSLMVQVDDWTTRGVGGGSLCRVDPDGNEVE